MTYRCPECRGTTFIMVAPHFELRPRRGVLHAARRLLAWLLGPAESTPVRTKVADYVRCADLSCGEAWLVTCDGFQKVAKARRRAQPSENGDSDHERPSDDELERRRTRSDPLATAVRRTEV